MCVCDCVEIALLITTYEDLTISPLELSSQILTYAVIIAVKARAGPSPLVGRTVYREPGFKACADKVCPPLDGLPRVSTYFSETTACQG